jgi:hypothetical protein
MLLNFFKSKINIAALILVLTSILPIIQDQNFSGMDLKGWVTFAISTLVIIFRTFMTSATSPLNKTK